jgi:hypothetical protein
VSFCGIFFSTSNFRHTWLPTRIFGSLWLHSSAAAAAAAVAAPAMATAARHGRRRALSRPPLALTVGCGRPHAVGPARPGPARALVSSSRVRGWRVRPGPRPRKQCAPPPPAPPAAAPRRGPAARRARHKARGLSRARRRDGAGRHPGRAVRPEHDHMADASVASAAVLRPPEGPAPPLQVRARPAGRREGARPDSNRRGRAGAAGRPSERRAFRSRAQRECARLASRGFRAAAAFIHAFILSRTCLPRVGALPPLPHSRSPPSLVAHPLASSPSPPSPPFS